MNREQIRAVIELAVEYGRLIRSAKQSALGGIPNGELYARVMGHISLEQHTAILNMLKEQKLIEETNHLLVWKAKDI